MSSDGRLVLGQEKEKISVLLIASGKKEKKSSGGRKNGDGTKPGGTS